MSLRARVLKGTLSLAAGRSLGDVCSLARNIIVARMLTPADVGIGATFWITVALLQMISDLASDRLLVQAKDGDEPRFQATVHLWEFGRGLINSILLFAAAWPVAHLFKAPEALWAFQCVALVPLLRGLSHLDITRFHRRLHYRPQVTIELSAQIAALALAYPLCRWLGDYSAVLAIALLQGLIQTIGSHVAAERSYRWAWSGAHLRRMFAFGWPLLANGLLLFAIMQGDHLIVGTAFSTHELGLYAMAFALATAPFMLVGSVLNPVALPLLSAVQDQPAAFERRVRLCNGAFALAAGVAGIPLLVSAPWLLRVLYGAEYGQASGVFAWLVVARMVWLLRHTPTTAAMARSDTKNALAANVFRVSGVVLAILAAALSYSLAAIALAAVIGEFCALLASTIRLRRLHGVAASATLVPLQVLLAAIVAAGLLQAGGYSERSLSAMLLAAVLIALYGAALLLVVPSLKAEMHRGLSAVRSRLGSVLVRVGDSRP